MLNCYIHTVDGSRITYDPEHLNLLKGQDYFLGHFRGNDLVLYEGDSFIVTLKEAPYSDRDCMIAYKGPDTKPDLTQLTNAELGELREILTALSKGYFEKLGEDSDAIFGINTSVIPQAGSIQSMQRLHFHATVLDCIEHTRNNISTMKVDIDLDDPDPEHIKKFALRDANTSLLKACGRYLNDKGVVCTNLSGYPNLEIDVPTHDGENFSAERMSKIMEVYALINSFQGDNIDWSAYNKNTTGFALALKVNKPGNPAFRFFEKQGGDSAGSMEVFPHTLIRNRKDNPSLPDMKDFRDAIARIF